jgi:hypothetical protein
VWPLEWATEEIKKAELEEVWAAFFVLVVSSKTSIDRAL